MCSSINTLQGDRKVSRRQYQGAQYCTPSTIAEKLFEHSVVCAVLLLCFAGILLDVILIEESTRHLWGTSTTGRMSGWDV